MLLLLLLWCMLNIHFRIGSKHLKILVFSVPIRKIALDQIAYVSKREPRGVAERWYSTFKTGHRLLTIERKSGLRKHICITPTNRYVFLADLKSAVRRVDPGAEWAALKNYDDDAEGAELPRPNEGMAGGAEADEPAADEPAREADKRD
jgi:hypothetical protein